MPIFEYKAITSSGKSRKGIVDADTPRDARSKLRGDHTVSYTHLTLPTKRIV